MAEIRAYPLLRHLRSEPSAHILRYRRGGVVRSGRGLSFWFLPMSTGVAELPMDDRDLYFLFHGRTRDFQDVTVQGVVTFRVADPDRLASRVDFSIDLKSGGYLKAPLEQIEGLISGMAQQLSSRHIAERTVRELLAEPLDAVQARIDALRELEALTGMGLEVVSVRVNDIKPTPELEKALETPTREALQQQADEATFQRRAQAVEKERAIAENELQNQIELARREEQLIEQRGTNDRRRAREEAEAKEIEATAKAERSRVEAQASATRIREIEGAKVEAERTRMDVYRDLPSPVMMGLAARELAGKLQTIEHLNLSPDVLGPLLTSLMTAGTRHLES